MKVHWYGQSLHGTAENLEDTCEKCLHLRLNLPTDSFHGSQLTCFPVLQPFNLKEVHWTLDFLTFHVYFLPQSPAFAKRTAMMGVNEPLTSRSNMLMRPGSSHNVTGLKTRGLLVFHKFRRQYVTNHSMFYIYHTVIYSAQKAAYHSFIRWVSHELRVF